MKQFKDLTITGPDEQLTALVDKLLVQLPSAGWDLNGQGNLPETETDRFWWRFTPATNADIQLFLCRTPDRVCVSNITPVEGSGATLSKNVYNQIIDKFYEEVNKLISKFDSFDDLNPTLTSDNADITEHISPEAAQLLDNFSFAANKYTGSAHSYDFERWAKFLIQVHKEKNASLDVNFLSNWLVEELEWPDESADKLVNEYEFAKDLLEIYDGASQ